MWKRRAKRNFLHFWFFADFVQHQMKSARKHKKKSALILNISQTIFIITVFQKVLFRGHEFEKF